MLRKVAGEGKMVDFFIFFTAFIFLMAAFELVLFNMDSVSWWVHPLAVLVAAIIGGALITGEPAEVKP